MIRANRFTTGLLCSVGFLMGFAVLATGARAEPLRVVMSSTPSFTYTPFLVAEATQFDALEEELGREIEITYAPTPTPALLALIGGEQDIGIMYLQHAIKSQAEGQDIVALAALMQNPTMALLARPDLPEIDSIEDLEGRVFGVVGLGSGHHLVGLGIAQAAGIDPDDITWRSTGGVAGWIPAMRAKRVDVMLASEPTISKILDEGIGRVILDLHQRDVTQSTFGGSLPTVSILARRDFVEENPEVVQAFVQANLDALEWIHNRTPEEIIKVLPEALRTEPNAASALKRVIPAVSETGEVPEQAITTLVDLMTQLGELPEGFTLKPEDVIYQNAVNE